ncbi:unnamed protein product [Acanthosepion pharaonis]|uniref:Uncharacterized protein n=1 Tax=Acanthosepion pharaonis TaxID=158019 RepID=A0A812CGS0_ACAPH|nr:unnamed protein product [Sepia pharaonis]
MLIPFRCEVPTRFFPDIYPFFLSLFWCFRSFFGLFYIFFLISSLFSSLFYFLFFSISHHFYFLLFSLFSSSHPFSFLLFSPLPFPSFVRSSFLLSSYRVSVDFSLPIASNLSLLYSFSSLFLLFCIFIVSFSLFFHNIVTVFFHHFSLLLFFL